MCTLRPAMLNIKGCTHGTRERKEDMICIKLAMPKKPYIEDALEKYIESEMLDGSNKVDCGECKEFMEANNMTEALEQKAYKQPTLSRACFGELPNLLVIALNRFELDYETWETVKRNDRVEFPMVLNMEPYTKEFIEANEAKQEESSNENDLNDTSKFNSTRVSRANSNDFLDSNDKYAYRLRGVVIHKGIAQGGHYYSLGRVPDNEDDGGDGKWYKFNDETITPFPVENLPDEAFGGFETRSYRRDGWNNNGMQDHKIEKMHSASLLFYERIHKQDVPIVFNDNTDEHAVAAHVSSSSEQAVWDANSAFIRNSYLFESSYSNFLLNICRNAPTETSTVYTAPPDDASGTNETTQSLKSLATVGIRHFLDVVLHASNKKNVDKWHIALRRHLNKNVAASIWFLSCLSQGEWLSEILLECDSRNSREMLVSLAGASISAVSPFENGQSVSGGKSRSWTCKLAQK